MSKNKLAIIGGSGLYDVEEFKERELLDIETSWGKPSDQILKTKYNSKEVYFLPRHGRGHFINPSNINFRANIDALKQLGVTDIVSISAVGSLKDELPPGKWEAADRWGWNILAIEARGVTLVKTIDNKIDEVIGIYRVSVNGSHQSYLFYKLL